MGRACSMSGEGRGQVYTGFWWGNLKDRDHLGDPGIDWRITLRWIYRTWDVGVRTGIYLAEDRDRWWALLNAVMNLWVP